MSSEDNIGDNVKKKLPGEIVPEIGLSIDREKGLQFNASGHVAIWVFGVLCVLVVSGFVFLKFEGHM